MRLTNAINTAPLSEWFFHRIASRAIMVRKLTVERTRAGLKVACQPDRMGGRTPTMTDSTTGPPAA